jgi:hypothetical protein
MHRLLLCASVLVLAAGGRTAEPAERRTIGRAGAGLQLGGFYDLGDPAIELRGWANRIGASVSFGRHLPEVGEPGFTTVSSDPGKQVTGGVLLAFLDRGQARAVAMKLYGTAGVVHVTQARARWESATPTRDGTIGYSAVEGGTGTWPFAGAGAEIGLAKVPGLTIGSELLFTFSGDGEVGPGVRVGVRYYPW